MLLTGQNYTGFTTSAKGDKTFQAFAPGKNSFLQDNFHIATETELEYVLSLSKKAFQFYSEISYEKGQPFWTLSHLKSCSSGILYWNAVLKKQACPLGG